MERRLAAILAADVVGFSRLMGEDEAGTLADLKTHRAELIDPKIAEHKGRIVKLMGDGALVEFSSVVDAVLCAAEIQNEMANRNAGIPKDKRICFRIGINLGDVIVEGGDIYGDGVNIAARLEALAVPGGVCVSRTVFNHVKNKVALAFKDLGEHTVKNIPEPVRVYSVLAEKEALAPLERRGLTSFRAIAAISVVALAAAGLLLVLWQPWRSDFPSASVERMAFPLPEQPSIAVVPFRSLSADKGDAAFVDAFSEFLIATLVKHPQIFVVSKESSFKLAETTVEVRDVSERLGVRYVLQGSYERSGSTLRISSRLSDALQGRLIWSKANNVPEREVLAALQTIAENVGSALKIGPIDGQSVPFAISATDSFDAWTLHVRASAETRKETREGNAEARALWSRATEHDPEFALAHLMIGRAHWTEVRSGWSDNPAKSLQRAESSALTVLELDPNNAGAYALLGALHLFKMDHGLAVAHGQKAVSLSPNSAEALAMLAMTQCYVGQAEEAERLLKTAIRLNPFYPAWYLFPLAEAYRLSGRYDRAIETAKEELRRRDDFLTRTRLALYYAQSGREDLAKAEIGKVLEAQPKMTLANWAEAQYFQDPAQLAADLAALKQAGLPEILSFECLMRNVCP